ncbi:MAG TPA: hypothetical protein VN923_20540 [Thermoanaerobaculia bacterium]|nr:hypothetical protein [Thermoanaerobaculia bacterium]
MRNLRLLHRVLALSGWLLLAGRTAAVAAVAVDGVLDSTFNGNGRVIADIGLDARPRAVAAMPDGKVVLVADAKVPLPGAANNYAIVVIRWNADGTRDATFGPLQNGVAIIEFDLGAPSWLIDVASSVAVQPDGKIVVGGYSKASDTTWYAVVARLSAAGYLDATFGGGDGKVILSDLGSAWGCAVALRKTGGSILATPRLDSGESVVVQLTAGGERDVSFGFGGQTEAWDCGARGCGWFVDTLEMPDGGLLALAETSSGDEIILVRYLGEPADGELDPSFGNGGVASFTPLGFPAFYVVGMSRDPSGKVTIMVQQQSAPWHAALLRVKGAQPDPTFGTGGWVDFVYQPPSSGTTATVSAFVVQPDGKPIIAGSGLVGGSWNFVVSRRTANGKAVDSSFSGGWSTVAFDFGGGLTDAASLVTLGAGRVVAAGKAEASSNWLLAGARLDNSLLWKDDFESGTTWFWSGDN